MKEYVNKMNIFLANQMLFYVKLHNMHWYLHGKGFFVMHPKLEEFYEHTSEVLDNVAERILMLGFAPIASVKKAQTIGTIKELDDVGIEMNDMLKVTLADYEKLAKEANDIILMGQEKNDDVTIDMYTSILSSYHKTIWMIKTALK
jgi:starvation-inducible DNA-binding protein